MNNLLLSFLDINFFFLLSVTLMVRLSLWIHLSQIFDNELLSYFVLKMYTLKWCSVSMLWSMIYSSLKAELSSWTGGDAESVKVKQVPSLLNFSESLTLNWKKTHFSNSQAYTYENASCIILALWRTVLIIVNKINGYSIWRLHNLLLNQSNDSFMILPYLGKTFFPYSRSIPSIFNLERLKSQFKWHSSLLLVE